MKTQNGFTLMKGVREIVEYLKKQNPSRKITRIQIHHMDLPNYDIWEKTDKKKFDEPHFGRTNSLNDYGKNTWGSKDVNGKYIAQHFNIFPDGYITSGRSLSNNPIGIRGWNDNAICIEIYGDFDKGKDTMVKVQKDAVIALVGELCKRFKITPSENTIRYHAWFTSKGTYLGTYVAGKSGKTCPGTNFFGGNTMDTYKKNFLPAIQAYLKHGSVDIEDENSSAVTVNKMVKVTVDELNIREEPTANSSKMGEVKKGDVFTIVKQDGNWGYLKSGAGWIHLGYAEPVKSTGIVDSGNSFKVRVTTEILNIRKNPDVNSSKMGSVKKGEVFTITKTSGDWGYLKSGAGWINLDYTKKI